jgi:AcrR family transcriptional regulator
MSELDPRTRAAITKRNNTRRAFLNAATEVFAEYSYPDIRADDIPQRAGRSSTSFYNFFVEKSDWAAAVLDSRLNDALDRETAAEPGTPHSRLLGYFGLLGAVSAPLPGITIALVDERREQEPYSELLPRYYGEVTHAFQDGQEQQVFRIDIPAAEMADSSLTNIAVQYAIHLDDTAARARIPSLALDGFAAKE